MKNTFTKHRYHVSQFERINTEANKADLVNEALIKSLTSDTPDELETIFRQLSKEDIALYIDCSVIGPAKCPTMPSVKFPVNPARYNEVADPTSQSYMYSSSKDNSTQFACLGKYQIIPPNKNLGMEYTNKSFTNATLASAHGLFNNWFHESASPDGTCSIHSILMALNFREQNTRLGFEQPQIRELSVSDRTALGNSYRCSRLPSRIKYLLPTKKAVNTLTAEERAKEVRLKELRDLLFLDDLLVNAYYSACYALGIPVLHVPSSTNPEEFIEEQVEIICHFFKRPQLWLDQALLEIVARLFGITIFLIRKNTKEFGVFLGGVPQLINPRGITIYKMISQVDPYAASLKCPTLVMLNIDDTHFEPIFEKDSSGNKKYVFTRAEILKNEVLKAITPGRLESMKEVLSYC